MLSYELRGGKEQRTLQRSTVWALVGAKRCTARNFTMGRKAIEFCFHIFFSFFRCIVQEFPGVWSCALRFDWEKLRVETKWNQPWPWTGPQVPFEAQRSAALDEVHQGPRLWPVKTCGMFCPYLEQVGLVLVSLGFNTPVTIPSYRMRWNTK